MPGLLAAERVPACAQLLEDVPVADLGGPHRDTVLAHRQVQAEVAHHRGDQRVVDELARLVHGDRQHRHDLVAVDVAAVGVDGQAAVGVAVVGDADVRAVRADGLAQRAEVGRAHPVVDVEPVRVGVQGDDVGAGPRVAVRGDRGRGAVRAVDHHPHPGQRLRGGRQQVRQVALAGVRQVAHPPDARTGRAGDGASSPCSTASSMASGSLCPPAANSLMPLSGIALCDAEIITPRSAPRASTR